MKKMYPMLLLIFFLPVAVLAQTHFRKGYDIDYNSVGSIPGKDLNFLNFPGITNDYFTGGTTACSGGIKKITKIKQGSISQSMLNLDNGQELDIDLGLYPYATIRVQSTANTDIQMTLVLRGSATPYPERTFTIKGGGAWNIIRLDFSDQPVVTGGSTNEIHWRWNEPGTTTYPYDLNFDYIRFGDLGDPDTAVKMSMANVTPNPIIVEKEAGEQTLTLAGISNGIDVANLSLSQTNTKSSIFEGVPTFDPIQPDGSCIMKYTPKTGTIGASNMHVILKYNRGDSVIKYKSVWFDINIVTDPKMTIGTNVNAQMNQPKVNVKITAATNSIGGSSKLGVTATSTNTNLVTNLLVDGDTIKSDGTATLSFIPGLDKCGTDEITVVLTDKVTSRAKEDKVNVTVTDPSNLCVPDDTASLAKQRMKFEVYPNPASDIATIRVSDPKGYAAELIDITGRTILAFRIPAGKLESDIALDNLNPGIYFISITNGKMKSVQKLIIR